MIHTTRWMRWWVNEGIEVSEVQPSSEFTQYSREREREREYRKAEKRKKERQKCDSRTRWSTWKVFNPPLTQQ